MAYATIMGPVHGEFADARLGDQRRTNRLPRLAEAIDRNPSVGFPRAMGSSAELEALYRFLNNSSFSADQVVEPHIKATLERARRAKETLVLHDTTYVEMTGEAPRAGMGVTTTNNRQGFLAHIALVVDGTGQSPLGVAHVETLTRTGTKWRARRNRTKVDKSDRKRESARWLRAVAAIEHERAESFEAIHVTDAEGDFFEFLASMRALEARFVVRAGQLTRTVCGPEGLASLRAVIDGLAPKTHRDISLGERRHARNKVGYKTRRRHPARAGRVARVAIASTKITVQRTRYTAGEGEPFEINVVRVWEPKPPKNAEPIEWVLMTTEKVSSVAALGRVVDIYRQRWMIEQYFKALKTGCSLEKRQIASYQGMRKVLALLIPIAYRLLLLRGLLRDRPRSRPKLAFDDVDLLLLAKGQRTPSRIPKTIAEALSLLARLGGHIKNNGPPGWMTLGAGYETLLTLRLGWTIAQENKR